MTAMRVRGLMRSKTTKRLAGGNRVGSTHIRRPRKIVEARLSRWNISYADFTIGLTRSGIKLEPALLANLAQTQDRTFRNLVRIAKSQIEPTEHAGPRFNINHRPPPAEVAQRVLEHMIPLIKDGTLTQPEAEAALQAITERLPDHEDPTEMLGPYYDTSGLRRRLGVTRQALAGRVQRNTLLGVEADDGSILYPVWQFDRDMKVLAGLSAILQELHRVAIDGFSKAVWLATPQEELSNKSSAEWLASSGDTEHVRRLAEADVSRMLA